MDILETVRALQEKEVQLGYDALAAHERVVVDVAALEAEVNNGGLEQFFFNSAGDRVAATIDALESIGASRAAEIVKQACQLFPGGQPKADRDLRQDQLEHLDPNSFESLDERFYSYPDPLEELVEAYWEKTAPPA